MPQKYSRLALRNFFLFKLFNLIRRQLMQKLEKNTVGPSEADYVLLVSYSNTGFLGSRDHIVFFEHGLGALEIFQHHMQKVKCNAICVGIESVAFHSLDSD